MDSRFPVLSRAWQIHFSFLLEIPHRDIKSAIGDMNAKVGSAITGTSTYGIYGLGNRNQRGEFLIEFCETNNFILANTLFEQHPRRSTLGHHQTVQIEASFQQLGSK